MQPLSWISPSAEVRASDIHGRGLFARTAIARRDVVAIKGGYIFDRATVASLVATLGPAEIPVADGFYIGPVEPGEREGGMLFTNR